MIAAALEKLPGFDRTTIEDIYVGCGEPYHEQGANLARRIAILLGLDTVPAATVNRFCSSSLQTTRMAAHAIKAGEGHVFVSAGVECVSRYVEPRLAGVGEERFHNPLFEPAKARSAVRSAHRDRWSDPRLQGELPDVYIGMGETAENVADLYAVTRADQDEFALRSQRLAAAARERGYFTREISAISTPGGSVVATDDSPRPDTTLEGLAGLGPAFREGGSVTAGNCCPLSDGAAAVVVMSDTRASELGIAPLARIVATGVSALSPEIMGLGPVDAVRKTLALARMTIDDVDLFEINEAFAAQVIPCYRVLGVPIDRLNVNGGAIALGHPFGMTGARMAGTLIHSLEERDAVVGLMTMCVAGGQGMAMILERLS